MQENDPLALRKQLGEFQPGNGRLPFETSPAPGSTGKAKTSITTPDGVDIAVEIDGAGPITCVFLHGLADGSYIWDGIRAELVPHFRTVAIDMRGHGASSWRGFGQYKLQHYAADVEFVLKSLSLDDYVVIGHSLGGSIIAQAWASFPPNLRALVLIEAPAAMDKELWSMLRQRIIESYREYRSAEEYYELLRANQPLMMPKTAYRLAESSLLPTPDGKLRPKFDIAVVEKDFDNRREWLPDFSGCPLPVLILRGAGSAFLSKSQAEKLTARLPRGTLITVELAGHAIMSDNPKGFQKALIPFLFKIRSAHDV